MAEVLLHVAFVDLGRRRQAGAQRVAGELLLPLALRKVAAHACGDRQALDQARDVAVVEFFRSDLGPTTARNTGPRAMRANFSQAVSAATGQVRSDEPRPISTSRQPVLPRSVRSTPSSKNSGQPEPSSESSGLMTRPTISERRRPPAKPSSRIARSRRLRRSDGGQGVEHGHDMLGQQRLLLDGRPAVGAADAAEHDRDVAVLAVEGQGALGEVPGERREPPLDRRDSAGFSARAHGAGSERREIEADAFGVGERPQVEALAGAPAQIVAPVGGVGAVGVLRRRGARVGAGDLDQRLESCGEGASPSCSPSDRAGGRFAVIGAIPADRAPG